MSENKILIISGCKYPDGDAGSVRIHSLVKLFKLCNMDSVVIGKGKSVGNRGAEYDGVHYYSFRSSNTTMVSKMFDRLLFCSRIKRFLSNYGNDYSHIMIVDIPFRALDFVVKYARNHNIQLLHDSLEWYSPSEFRFGKFNPLYIHRDLLNRKKITPAFKVIAISRYLQNYFDSKGCSTIRIPSILECPGVPTPNPIVDKIIVTYAGLPERKDKVVEILEGYCSLEKDERGKIELRIIGITLEQLSRRFSLKNDQIERFKAGPIFYGRLKRSEVIQKLKESHFSIFYRDASERYAKAGFPTKVAESTSLGVPVITNLSSDLSDYLLDGFNSIIIQEGENAITDSLRLVSHLNNTDYFVLSGNAFALFKNTFQYDVYSTLMKGFLDN